MTPRQFLARYGQPVCSAHPISVGKTVIVRANVDRYLLAIFAADGDIVFRPSYDTSVIGAQSSMGAASTPFILTHNLHGSLVNMEWIITGSGVGSATVVTIIEGFLVEIDSKGGIINVAKGSTKKQISNSGSRGNPVTRKR